MPFSRVKWYRSDYHSSSIGAVLHLCCSYKSSSRSHHLSHVGCQQLKDVRLFA